MHTRHELNEFRNCGTKSFFLQLPELKNNFPLSKRSVQSQLHTILQKQMSLKSQYDKNITLTIDKPENTAPESWESNSDPKGRPWPKMMARN